MQTQMFKETDKSLRDLVLRQIEWEPEVSATDIGVTTQEGVVTLTGFVHHYSEKLAAERAAKSVYGVKAVANDIEVSLSSTRNDPEIARDIVHRMNADVAVPKDQVKVTVRNAFVTLEGTVDWNFQRFAAAECANRVSGVRGVTNLILVKPRVSATNVKTKIEEALKRNAEVDSRRITVSTQDSTVHLYGSVRSWFERDEAERAAWSAPGVSNVVDHISVAP